MDYAAEAHLQLLMEMRLLPVMIPVAEGTLACLSQYQQEMRGLLVVEGEDVHPSRYPAIQANFDFLENTHPLKDAIESRLIRYALRRHLPVLGICRGSQLLNVLCGGTLYGDVRKEKGSKRKHISPGKHYDDYRHPITVVPATPLAAWYREKGIRVNSFHHQGVRKLAARFRPMAYADDGLIEAFYDPKADFVVGLQFHPERMLPEYQGNLRVWRAFGAAVHRSG